MLFLWQWLPAQAVNFAWWKIYLFFRSEITPMTTKEKLEALEKRIIDLEMKMQTRLTRIEKSLSLSPGDKSSGKNKEKKRWAPALFSYKNFLAEINFFAEQFCNINSCRKKIQINIGSAINISKVISRRWCKANDFITDVGGKRIDQGFSVSRSLRWSPTAATNLISAPDLLEMNLP